MNTIQKAVEAVAAIEIPADFESVGFRSDKIGTSYVYAYVKKEFVSVSIREGETDGVAEALFDKAAAIIKEKARATNTAEAEFGAFFQAAA